MAKNWEQKIPKALVAKVQKTNAKPAKLAIEERNLQREISALSALEDKYTENLMIQHLPDDTIQRLPDDSKLTKDHVYGYQSAVFW